jgi:Uma2 family endonuclease
MAVVISRASIDHVAPGEHVPTADKRVVMNGITWDAFESFLSMRGNALPRVSYLEGTLELMSPSKDHEILKKYFAAVVEEYLDHLGIVYDGAGSWLLKHAPLGAGLEPDECYLLHDPDKSRHDLAIEVVWTSGGISKLEIYERLGVGEVWFWDDDAITVHVLTDRGYEQRDRSACLPGFDFALVLAMLKLPTLSEVRRQIRAHFASK